MSVTVTDVKKIIDTDENDTYVGACITTADTLVTDELAGEGLSSDLTDEITKWLAAHFVAIRDPRVSEEKVSVSSTKYMLGVMGQGLMATPYGQQAVVLDTSGSLAQLGKPSMQIDTIDFLGTG